nr:hypothetical protein [Tanacetum cinerariifolium]
MFARFDQLSRVSASVRAFRPTFARFGQHSLISASLRAFRPAFARSDYQDDQDDLSSDGKSQEGDVANKADNNESDADRVSELSFMHENDTAHKDVNSYKKGER